MTALRAWLAVPFLGQPRFLWALALAVLVVWVAWVGLPGLAALTAPLLWVVSWVGERLRARRGAAIDFDVPDRQDPARDAQTAHQAAVEEARALAAEQAASAARERAGARAAAGDPADDVAARVAARGRIQRCRHGRTIGNGYTCRECKP